MTEDNPKAFGYPISPVPFNEVTLNDTFWLPRLKTQKAVTVPFALQKTEGAVESLRRCAAFLHGEATPLPKPHRFVSSDLYKVMEGAAYLLTLDRDPRLEVQIDEIIEIISAAQQDDGYLYVSHICGVANASEMGEKPYSWVVHGHELYNMGHMYEGAVAYYRATGKRNWLDVAEKSARHINHVFFEGDPNYNDGNPVNQAPGHQEIELALCKLYVATGNDLYLEMAKRFLDIRGVTYKVDGEGTMSPRYAQQHRPVREQESAVGHAVRAAYMYAGMADVSALTGDASYVPALNSIWDNIVNEKMHITGGLGAVHGIEGFGPDYVLPNLEAYNETCAAIANVFFNHRMFLLHGDAKYFDVAEVALFNNSLAGVNLEGDRFFYVNPLEADGHRLFNHGAAGRSPWFDCACCPSNIARLMPQVSGYMYAAADRKIYTLLYAAGQAEVGVNGDTVAIEQKTDYPFGGRIKLILNPGSPMSFGLNLRIPTWTGGQFVPGNLYHYVDSSERGWSINVNGEPLESDPVKGFVEINREWSQGDTVDIELSMPVKFSACDTRVEANHNRVAVTRGPLVYCAEEIDNADRVQAFLLPKTPSEDACRVDAVLDGPLKGVPLITIPAMKVTGETLHSEELLLVPYLAWNNRGNASMNVWLPQDEATARQALARNPFDASIYGKLAASSCGESDVVAAVADGRRPQSSSDTGIPRWSSGRNENEQWLMMKFDHPQKVESVGVYWSEDSISDIVKPAEWRVEYLKAGKWQEFDKYLTDFYGTDLDRYNVVHPASELECDGLRIWMTPKTGSRVGIMDIDLTTLP